MASTGLQLVGFILGVISWIGMMATCVSPEWRMNSHGQTLIDNTVRYDGLWTRCRSFPSGQVQCSLYNNFFLGLPSVLKVCRALMIASICCGFIASITTILGMKCTSVGSSEPRSKARAATAGGLLFLVAAALGGASVSYYANGIVQDYYNPTLNENRLMHLKFEYGSALFVGWVSLALGVAGGLILGLTSVFVIMRLNGARRRQKSLNFGSRKSERPQHQSSSLEQHQRNVHARMSASTLTKEHGGQNEQHTAQNNAKQSSKSGSSHQQDSLPSGYRERDQLNNAYTSIDESLKMSSERRRKFEESQTKQISDQPRNSIHRKARGSKSEGHRNSRKRESRTNRHHRNSSKTRRSTKEYV